MVKQLTSETEKISNLEWYKIKKMKKGFSLDGPVLFYSSSNRLVYWQWRRSLVWLNVRKKGQGAAERETRIAAAGNRHRLNAFPFHVGTWLDPRSRTKPANMASFTSRQLVLGCPLSRSLPKLGT